MGCVTMSDSDNAMFKFGDDNGRRVIVNFSCGVTSAVATELAIEQFKDNEIRVIYCDPGSEHEDNMRFLRDVEKWLGVEIEILRSDKYDDVPDVIRKRKFIKGPKGAPCTTELKKLPAQAIRDIEDINVFGFDVDEKERIDRYRKTNPEMDIRAPLYEANLTKENCLCIVERNGIKPPIMYELGFSHSNCVGCIKAGAGHWNHVRKVFPEIFQQYAELEREVGHSICRQTVDGVKDTPVFLDELDPDAGRGEKQYTPECSLFCGGL